MHGFDCNILAHDVYEDKSLIETYDVHYTNLENLCQQCDVIFLSIPLNSNTHHLIDAHLLQQMKKNSILINIARGGVVNTKDIVEVLSSNKIAAYGTDVYEHESNLFFYDHSENKPEDSLLQKLIDLPNVLLTPHQAFATEEALTNIAATTFNNIHCWQQGRVAENELTSELV